MNNKIRISTLLYQLLFDPIKIIKGIQLINYDKDEIDRFYFFSSIILGSLFVYVGLGKDYIGLIFVGLVMFPFIAFVNRQFISFVYYILFRYVGKIEISFEIVKTILYPVIVLEFLIRVGLSILFSKIAIIISIVGILSYLWIKLIIFWIMIYKMKQTSKKTIILIFTLACFEVSVYVISQVLFK